MILLFTMLLAVAAAPNLEHDLDEIARTAAVMLDGDICQRILTSRALEHMLKPDPRDRYADGDNYDVDDASFIATKKTLIRLSRLTSLPVDVNLWMPLPGDPPSIHIVIRNRNELSQFWKWGNLRQPMVPEMRTVLETGRRVLVKNKPGIISVLAPVRNSLGDIVGVVEAAGRIEPDPRENVK